MVIRKHTGTTMAANIPKLLTGMMALKAQAKNATAEVRDVTSMVEAACLKAYDNLKTGLSLMASIVNAFCQQSWKTNTSSEPIPMIMMKTEM